MAKYVKQLNLKYPITIFVEILQLWMGILNFHWRATERKEFQVFGFFFLVTGIFLYSDVLIMPAIRRFANNKL